MIGKKEKKSEVGPPGWIITFADLMSLLLTFFILLLSFAETDVRKFKAAVGSIKSAFGVQSDFLYEETPTANNPFKRDYAAGSQEWLDWNFAQPMISLQANEMCELEQQRIIREKSEIEYLKHQIEKVLAKELQGSQGIHVGMEGSKLRVRFSQNHFFEEQTALFNEEKIDLIKRLFSTISDKKLYIGITNYSEPLESSPQAFKKWKLSTDRSLVLAYITHQMDEAAIHDIKVESLSHHERKRRESQKDEIIDLFIGLTDEDLSGV